MLLTTYAAGLRLNEVLHLRVSDIDSARMTIRVQQGKGGQDRYTVLSPHLLDALRRYWTVGHPRTWVFPSQATGEPMHPTALQRAYQTADVLLTPTSPTVAFQFGEKGDNPFAMYLCDTYTIPSNLAGHPGMSVPFGTGAHGMPVGVQVLAGTLQEPVMFRVGAALERAVAK